MSTRKELHTWYQGKRVPLYFVVGATFAGELYTSKFDDVNNPGAAYS